jgi:hypothetical protein
VDPVRRAAAHPSRRPPARLPPSSHPDRIIFDKLVQVLVFGCGYRRIADHSCSATTLRRRRDEWITAGVAEQPRLAVLAAYDRLFGLEVEQGLKRSLATETGGIPLAAVAAPANRRDDGLLAATLDAVTVIGPPPTRPTVHLDAGYDYQPCRAVLAARAWPARSPGAASRHRSRRGAVG